MHSSKTICILNIMRNMYIYRERDRDRDYDIDLAE